MNTRPRELIVTRPTFFDADSPDVDRFNHSESLWIGTRLRTYKPIPRSIHRCGRKASMAAEPVYWGGRRRQRFAKEIAARKQPCTICGQPIDYTLRYPDPDSFSVEHRIPKSVRRDLALDPTNMAAAHLRCNQSRGDRDYRPGIGATSTEW